MKNKRAASESKVVIKCLASCFVAPFIMIGALPLFPLVIALIGNDNKYLDNLVKSLIYIATLGN